MIPQDESLPNWYDPEVAAILLKQFRRHVLGLLIAVRQADEGTYHQQVFTGFLLYHKDIVFWVTAGHVVNGVKRILETPDENGCILRWADDCKIKGAESVPASIELCHLYSTYTEGSDTDIGLIAIPRLDASSILANDSIQAINSQIWYRYEEAKPDGYYILGFPQDLQRDVLDKKADGIITHTLHYSYSCVPVERVDFHCQEVNKNKFRDESDFYGRIMLPLGAPGPTSIVGMSGGPIFSIEKRNDQLIYRLFGIQKSWDDERKIIRGEHIGKLIRLIDGEKLNGT